MKKRPPKRVRSKVYLRTTLSSGLEDVTKPGKNSEAKTTTDQQGFRVFKIPVGVTEDAGTPIVENPIKAQTLLVDEEEFTKDLENVFSDPNDEDLSYQVTVSDDIADREIVSAEVRADVLVVDPLSAGSATVKVTAKDGTGKSVTDSFTVSVENPTPTLTSISPSAGGQGANLSVTLKGSGFVDEVSTVEV